MANGKTTKNLKIRTWLVLGIVIALVAAAVFGLYYWRKSHVLKSTAQIAGGPRIESIPGAGNPSTEYVKKQNQENALGVESAKKQGTSAVPTITRSNFQGDLKFFESGQPQNCAIIASGGKIVSRPEDCDIAHLQRARQAGVQAEELRCLGCACPVLKEVGYTAGELKASGFSAKDLKDCGFTAQELKAAGFSAKELKAAGFTAKQLKDAGFSAAELKQAGFDAKALKDAGFTAKQLKDAGFSTKDLKDAGFTPAEIKAATNAKAEKDCSVDRLKKARARGISATQLREQGCGLAALKAAGYTAAELKNAGFTAKQLKDAGFSAKDLKDAGFSAKDLKDAGFSAGDLKNAGFSAKDLKDAGFDAKALRDAGYSAADLKKAGFTPDALKKVGFSSGDLIRAGFSPSTVSEGRGAPKDCSVASLKKARAAGYSARYLKDHGCPESALRAAGYDREELQAAGFGSKGALSALNNSSLGSSAQLPSIGGDQNSVATQLEQARAKQAQMLAIQQRQNLIRQLQSQMNSQAQQLLSAWGNNPTQQIQETTIKEIKGTNNGKNGSESGKPEGPVIKAGTILFAVLDTGINSDQTSPIMATIVNGDLKGSKLLGSFQRVDKRVVLSFTTLSIPNVNNSVSMNAVAIDANTARTALADNVDNHYLLRYGSLFASSFISGLGQAIDTSGSTTIDSFFGTSTQHGSYSLGETIASALGEVGDEFSSATQELYNTPPTVTVDAGSGIGILFMKDLTLQQEAMNNGDTQ
jgi:intracellular multiplication protein IcmE